MSFMGSFFQVESEERAKRVSDARAQRKASEEVRRQGEAVAASAVEANSTAGDATGTSSLTGTVREAKSGAWMFLVLFHSMLYESRSSFLLAVQLRW